MAETCVCLLALARFHLETGLDHVARGCEVGCGHTGDCAGGEELHNAELVCSRFAKNVSLEVRVGGEVDGGEGDVAEKAGASALVESDETQVLDDPERGATRSAFYILGNLSLDLQADLDNFQGIGEDLPG